LIDNFYRLTGVPAVLNTSFNVKGQPIVETPLDAISTFSTTGLENIKG
jgi:carbamoyltransferase